MLNLQSETEKMSLKDETRELDRVYVEDKKEQKFDAKVNVKPKKIDEKKPKVKTHKVAKKLLMLWRDNLKQMGYDNTKLAPICKSRGYFDIK